MIARRSSLRCAVPSSTPQDHDAQRHALESAGVFVAESNADAVEAALRIAAAPPWSGSR